MFIVTTSAVLLDPIGWILCIFSGIVFKSYIKALIIPMTVVMLYVTIGLPSHGILSMTNNILGYALAILIEVWIVRAVRSKLAKRDKP